MSDTSDLDHLAADLTGAGIAAGFKVARIVNEWGSDVVDQAKVWAPRAGVPRYPETITHDVTIDGATIVGEAGPDAEVDPVAKLAPIFEYGAPSTGFAARAHMGPAHDRATANAIDKIADLGGDIL